MEIEELEVLELRARRREELLAHLDVREHGAAHVEQEQHLDGVVPLGHELEVEIAGVPRRGADGVGQVELLGGTLAREAAQAAQCDLDVARAELDLVVEVPELALVPHLDRAVVAVPVLADAHALGIEAIGAVGRGARGADPFRPTLVSALLLGQALAQRLEQLVEPAHRLDLRLLLVGEQKLGELLEPFLGNLRRLLGWRLDALEAMAEDAVELVEVALVLNEC